MKRLFLIVMMITSVAFAYERGRYEADTLDEFITHAGDTDSYLGFDAANSFVLVLGGNTITDANSAGFSLLRFAPATVPGTPISGDVYANGGNLWFYDGSAWHDLTGDGVFQPLDPNLTAIAGLTTAADQVTYWTGAGTAAQASLTAAGRAILDDASAAAQATTLGLGTGNSPQFTGIELSHATANTLTASSGIVSIEGKVMYSVDGNDVDVADGGTGVSTLADGGLLIGNAGNDIEVVAAGATTEILVGGGASTAPVWTTATGTGAPVRGTSPTFTTSIGIGITPTLALHVSQSVVGSAVQFKLINTDNTDALSAAAEEISVGGASAGDPYLNFNIASVRNWTIGIDNSDSDKFKIDSSGALGGSDNFVLDTTGTLVIKNDLGVEDTMYDTSSTDVMYPDKCVIKTIGIVGSGKDFNFASAANNTEQVLNLGAIIPAGGVVDYAVLECDVSVAGTGSRVVSFDVGTTSGGAEILAGPSTDMEDDGDTFVTAAGTSPVLAHSTAARNVFVNATPTANWDTLSAGQWSIIVYYKDGGAIRAQKGL